MSSILNRLKNLENERSTVLRTAEPVLSRSRSNSNSRKRVWLIFIAIVVTSSVALTYKFKHLFVPQHPLATAASVDLSQSQFQQNELAIETYKAGDYKKSAETLETLIKAYPERAEFHINLAMAYFQLSKFDKAEEQLKLAITIDPKDSFAHNNLGLVAQQTKQEQLAEKSFLKAHELNPQSPEITLNLASHFEKTGQFKKSADYYQRYVSLPKSDKSKVEILKKRIPRLNSLAVQASRLNEEEEGV